MSTPLEKWVEEQARLAQPDRIHWCDGSEGEARRIIEMGMRVKPHGRIASLGRDGIISDAELPCQRPSQVVELIPTIR